MNIKNELVIEDFIYMEQMEKKYYSEEYITPYEEAYRWYLSNPNGGAVLEDDGVIIGFTDVLPVKQEVFDRMIKGTFNDKYLTTEDLVSMEKLRKGNSVNLILSCVLVEKECRKTDALRMLLNATMDYYRRFTEQGIRIDSIATSNVTEDGVRFSEKMGFERIGSSDHQTVLFRTSFWEFDKRVKAMPIRLTVANSLDK